MKLRKVYKKYKEETKNRKSARNKIVESYRR